MGEGASSQGVDTRERGEKEAKRRNESTRMFFNFEGLARIGDASILRGAISLAFPLFYNSISMKTGKRTMWIGFLL